jgi:hypothetical protein
MSSSSTEELLKQCLGFMVTTVVRVQLQLTY